MLQQYCFHVLVFWLWGLWDPSSLTRGGNHAPCVGRWSPNHWTSREVPYLCFLLLYNGRVVSDSFVTSWTVARQAPLWDFPGKNTGVGLSFPSPADLPDPGIKPTSALKADTLPLSHLGSPYLRFLTQLLCLPSIHPWTDLFWTFTVSCNRFKCWRLSTLGCRSVDLFSYN